MVLVKNSNFCFKGVVCRGKMFFSLNLFIAADNVSEKDVHFFVF